MARSLKILLLGALVVLFAGCASDGSFINPFSSSNDAAPVGGHFYSEFEDIPVPNEMREINSDTVITFAPSGVKCGMQRFKGRVEMVSLMNTMRRHMANNGWTLRSLLRAQRSILIFEKHDRMALIEINDGLLETEMRIVVASRLAGDSVSLDIRAYSTSSSSFSSGEQRLTQ
jgi:hypothetical protein